MNLRHSCGRDGCYMETLWDWTPLNGCFGNSGIRVSDIDGIVERNGHFLLLDGKRDFGDRLVKRGQSLLYRRLAELGFTVYLFHGDTPCSPRYIRMWLPGGEFIPEQPCDLVALQHLVSEWFQEADRRKGVA